MSIYDHEYKVANAIKKTTTVIQSVAEKYIWAYFVLILLCPSVFVMTCSA